jgi:hypothetical protein
MSADCVGCARRIGCREIALLKDLDPKAPSLARRARAGLKLLQSMPVVARNGAELR